MLKTENYGAHSGKYPERLITEQYGNQTKVFDGALLNNDIDQFSLSNNLLKTYISIDKDIFDNIPDKSLAEIISQKSVFDALLNRDVPTIFDTSTQNHKYTNREQELIEHKDFK